jgi:hypothetical protein
LKVNTYLGGLALSFVLFGLGCAIAIVPLMLIRGEPGRAVEFLNVWIIFGPLSVTGLAVTVGPVTLGLLKIRRQRLPTGVAALAGAIVSPALLLGCFLLLRERNETIGGLLQFWRNLPGEFIVGLIPHTIASAFFATWLAAKQPRNQNSFTQRHP